MEKPFPIFRETGELNYWDCVSQRLKRMGGQNFSKKFWARKSCEAAWNQHKKIIKRVKYGIKE